MKTNCVVKLGQLRRTDLRPAALILGRAMRDNPAHVRAFAISDAERRRQALERFFRPVLLGLHQRGLIYGAYRDNALVGICGIARPGFCQPTPLEKLRLLPAVVFGNPLGTALRVLNWADAWAHRDPAGASLASGTSGHRTLRPAPGNWKRLADRVLCAYGCLWSSCISRDRPTSKRSFLSEIRVHGGSGSRRYRSTELVYVPSWWTSTQGLACTNSTISLIAGFSEPPPIVHRGLIAPRLTVPGQCAH